VRQAAEPPPGYARGNFAIKSAGGPPGVPFCHAQFAADPGQAQVLPGLDVLICANLGRAPLKPRLGPIGKLERMTTQHYPRRTLPTPAALLSRAAIVRWSCACLSLALQSCAAAPQPQSPVTEVSAPEPQRAPWPEEVMPESVVHAELQTSAQAIKAGGKFLLAVRFDIASGYRISWTNPGDVGKSTRVEFEVPEGFSVGEIQFPAPTRFALPGGLVSYGYEHETAVFAEVTAPEHLPRNQAYRFDVKADWLACKHDCAKEELSAWLELVALASVPEPQLPSELQPYHAAIPAAFASLPTSSLDWKGSPAQPALTLTAAEVKWVDFFPGDLEQPKLIGVKPAGDALSLRFQGTSASKTLRGLAVGELGGKVAFFDVNVPWPE
jgi:DsbC/DsbD-like thiol-disulfide interchange protein